MKLEKVFEARDKLNAMRRDPDYSEALTDRLSSHRNPLLFYSYIKPNSEEHLISLHNHSDSGCHTLETMARVASERGYKIFAITDHNMDLKFDGKRVLYYEFDGRGIFVLKGMECRCRTEDSVMKDIILLGYENGVKPFKDIKDTIKLCKDKSGIVIATSSFNEGARGLNETELEQVTSDLDAMEIFNSCSGFGNLCAYDILAEEYAEARGIPGIYANDAHTLREIGLAGFGIPKQDISFLEKDPREIIENPDMLIQGLAKALKTKRIHNYGSFIPRFSLLYPDKFVTLSHKHAVLRPG